MRAIKPLPVGADRLSRSQRLVAVVSVTLSVAAMATFTWACWRNQAIGHPDVRPDRWHHLYLGLALSAVGAWRRRPKLMALGTIVAGDDAWQHLRHVTGAPQYASPLRAAFTHYLWPIPAIRWLTGCLDALFS